MSSERIERKDARPASVIVLASLFSIYFTVAPVLDSTTNAREKRNIKNICYTPSGIDLVDKVWIDDGLVEVIGIINNLAPISEELYTVALAYNPESECDLNYKVLATIEEVKENCGEPALYGGCYNPQKNTVLVGGDPTNFFPKLTECDSIPEIAMHELGHASGIPNHEPTSPLMRDGCNEIVEDEVKQIFWSEK